MREDLERMGYLRRISDGCDNCGSHCPSSSDCTFHPFGQAWTLTEKKPPAIH